MPDAFEPNSFEFDTRPDGRDFLLNAGEDAVVDETEPDASNASAGGTMPRGIEMSRCLPPSASASASAESEEISERSGRRSMNS